MTLTYQLDYRKRRGESLPQVSSLVHCLHRTNWTELLHWLDPEWSCMFTVNILCGF